MLLDISHNTIKQRDMLLDICNQKSERVMQTIDKINKSMGKNTIFIAASGIERPWFIQCNKRSSRYTTRWQELPTVFCL